MNTVPIPEHKLCLMLAFDLSECVDAAQLSSRDHDDAMKQAAKASGLFAPEAVYGKALTVSGDVTIEVAQDVPFDALATSCESTPLSFFTPSPGEDENKPPTA